MKKCPKCGSVYTNDFIYCDQDGAPLSPRSSKAAVWLVLGVVVLILVAAGFAAVPLVDAYVMSRMSFKLLQVSPRVDPGLSANIVVQVKNDSLVSPSLRSMKLNCSASGQKLAQVVWPSAGEPPVLLLAGDSAIIKVLLQPKAIPAMNLPPLAAACQGNAEVTVLGLPFTKKVSFEKKLL